MANDPVGSLSTRNKILLPLSSPKRRVGRDTVRKRPYLVICLLHYDKEMKEPVERVTVEPGGTRWNQVEPGGTRWNQVEPGGTKLFCADSNKGIDDDILSGKPQHEGFGTTTNRSVGLSTVWNKLYELRNDSYCSC
jgi:hypothetical protein